jgi:hypothetical protein
MAARLATALAAVDERSFWLLFEHMLRDTKPKRRRAYATSILWC